MRVEDIIGSTDEELVKLIYEHWTDSAVFNAAQAELIKRQTGAINRFNRSSTRLAWIMIWLATATTLLSVIAFFRRL